MKPKIDLDYMLLKSNLFVSILQDFRLLLIETTTIPIKFNHCFRRLRWNVKTILVILIRTMMSYQINVNNCDLYFEIFRFFHLHQLPFGLQLNFIAFIWTWNRDLKGDEETIRLCPHCHVQMKLWMLLDNTDGNTIIE